MFEKRTGTLALPIQGRSADLSRVTSGPSIGQLSDVETLIIGTVEGRVDEIGVGTAEKDLIFDISVSMRGRNVESHAHRRINAPHITAVLR